MKLTKRCLAVLLCFALLFPLLPANAFAADDSVFRLDNGYIEVSVSKENGGFLVNTVEGDLLKKSDNNKNLLYHSGDYDTSFVSLRIGSGENARDYLFGGKYGGVGGADVTQTADGRIIAVWSVEGITFTQTVSLAEDNANEHGMVSVSLDAQNNSGAAVPIQARILLDTCLGDRDYAHYQVSGGDLTDTMDTEQIITDEAALKSFYAVDDVADPGITAYVVSTPVKAAIGHWNNLAASLFDFAPDDSLDFTGVINDYLTADSACAMYYDLGTVASGAARSVTSYYGVYSNHTVNLENSVAINTVAPLRLELNKTRTAYVRQSEVGSADFAVTVSAENYKSDTAEDLENVILAVRSTGNLRSLSDSGAVINGIDYDSTRPLTISYSRMDVSETITKTLYFQAKPLVSASYERITIGMYRNSVTSENLLGEKIVYVLLPGSDGNIPQVSFISMKPDTIYSSGTRHLYAAITNDNIFTSALAQGTCTVKAYTADGRTAREIPADCITVTDGVADLALTEDIRLPVGSWYLQLEWTDEAVSRGIVAKAFQMQTASTLNFKVSDDPKYKNNCYGVLAAVKYGKGTGDKPYEYRLESFTDEAAFVAFESDKSKYTEILLVFRGDFTADNRYLRKNEDGKTVGAYYYTAVSKKTTNPNTRKTTVDNCITINNCLDFEGGTMSIYYEDYGRGQTRAEKSPILVEFDGDLYTSDARTSVWKGKAAITKLEQGGDYSLLHYDSNGKRKQMQAKPITLIWPNVYGVAQTLAGMAFKLAYGQFGVMEGSDSQNVYNNGELGRTIAFSASLSLKFMSSGDEDDEGTANYFGRMKELWKDWRGASIYQYAYHGTRFEQLTNINMNDSDKSGSKDKGVQASVMVQDILFGCGKGLVGLNFTVEIGVKNMIDSLPKLTGKLSVNTINNWSFGLAGSCKMSNKLNLEAKLSFKSYNNIPGPDEIYFFIGGFNPGINIDGCGVVWITGGGGGVSNLYDTVFCKSGVPPLKLIIAASFSIIQILDGNAKLTLALTGLDLTASDLKIFGEIEAIRKVQLGLQWYPDIKIQAGIYVSMFEQVIEGQGYIVLLGKNYTDWFFEMFILAALKIPSSVPLVGGMTLVGAELGVSTKKIWGAFEALKIGIGVTYYWGESKVIFGSSRDKAQPTYPNLLLSGYDGECEDIPIACDEENGRTLYAHIGTNFEAPRAAQLLSDGDLILMDAAGVWSNSGRTGHKFNLGAYAADTNEATAVQLSYRAESLAQAQELARGFTVKDESGSAFPLEFYDGANADSANANVTWDEETKTAAFGFTVTDDSQFNRNWFISTGETAADVVLYNVLPLPEVTGVSASGPLAAGGEAVVTWDGTGLDELDSISFFLTSSTDPAEDAGYPLTSDRYPNGVDETDTIGADKRVVLDVPADIPAGDYYLRAVYSKEDQLNGVIHSTGKIPVSNANTPAAADADVTAVGDLKFGVSIRTDDTGTDGYSVTIYNADGSPTDIAGLIYDKAASGVTEFEIGGRYTAPVKTDAEDPESANMDTETYGLEGGRTYVVGVTPYHTLDTDGDGEPDAVVYGREVTKTVELPAAETPAAALTAGGKTLTAVQDLTDGSVTPVFTADTLTVSAVFSEPVTGTWTLDNSEIWGKIQNDALPDTSVVAGAFNNTGSAAISLPELTDGDHILTVTGRAADGDSFTYSYPFTVDTTAPRLILSAPLSGSVFGRDGTLTVAGVTDADALLTISVDGQTVVNRRTVKAAGGTIDTDGVFALTCAVPDPDRATTHKVAISAADANGNRTEDHEIIVSHPGLGDIENIVLMVNGAIPSDGNIPTQSAGTAALTIAGVTSDNRRFALEPDRVIWNSLAAEGAVSVTADGRLTYDACAKGFVEALYEVSAGAYRTAALSLGSEPERGYVSVSSTVGGTAAGGGYYDLGGAVTLTATAGSGYRFDHWELNGVAVDDPKTAAITFTMPADSVAAKAVFAAVEPPVSGGGSVGGGLSGDETAPDPDRYVPYYLDENGKTVVIPLSAVFDGTPVYLEPKGKEVFFMENPVTFTDIAGHWAEKNIIWAAARGLFNGVENGKFDPNGSMTRAMFVTVLYRLAGSPAVTGSSRFTDVKKGSWYEKAVIWASANGVANGVSNTSFDPGADVTREQMCSFVARFLRTMGYSLTLGGKKVFKDADAIAVWAGEDVEYCQRAGIINGKPGDVFDPRANATRAENATVMKRMIESILENRK